MLKKHISVLLSITLVASLFCGCAKTETKTETKTEMQNETTELNANVTKYIQSVPSDNEQLITYGILSCVSKTEEEANNLFKLFGLNINTKYFNNLSSMMLALKSNQIDDIVLLPKSTAEYIKARNDDIIIDEESIVNKLKYCMATLETNKDVYDIFNNTLKEIIVDNTIKDLEQKYIKEFVESKDNPSTVDIPHFDGAKVIKVAVTGDLPPFDFVSSNGEPIGYNVALLSEIAKRTKINIELVTIDEAAKITALATGNVDVLFWLTGYGSNNIPSVYDYPKGVILTDCYYEDTAYRLYIKGRKLDKMLNKK